MPLLAALSMSHVEKGTARDLKQVPHNIRMHLTGYSGLRPLLPAGDAGR